jgi:flagellar biosynthesis chaperone FliJ
MPKKTKRRPKISKDDQIQQLKRSIEECSNQLSHMKQQMQALRAELDHMQARVRA